MTLADKPQVFVSHAQEDADFANALRTWLDDAVLGGVAFFVSSDRGSIPLGSEWASRIRTALTHSNLMLVLVSPASAERRWLHFEAGAGYSRGIPVVPVCVAGMRLPSLAPPLSMLEGVELPGEQGQGRLLQLVAESAALRVPAGPPALVLPARSSSAAPPETAKADTTSLARHSLADLTRARAATLLGKADQAQVGLVRSLIKEALFVMELESWSGNRDEPEKVLVALKGRLGAPVLIPQDVAFSFMVHAEQVAEAPWPDEPGPDAFDSRGFDRVRAMIGPYLDTLPSVGDYELALFQHPPEIYLPLLFLEMRTTTGYQNWNAIRLAADGEFGRVVLPVIEQALHDFSPPNPEYRRSVEIGRELLGSEFDAWHRQIKGRTPDEERAAYRDSFAPIEADEAE
jgi:hypothetical protein